jgi:hypothetical protein
MKVVCLIRQGRRMWWKLILIALWKVNLSIRLARWTQLGGWGVGHFVLIALK